MSNERGRLSDLGAGIGSSESSSSRVRALVVATSPSSAKAETRACVPLMKIRAAMCRSKFRSMEPLSSPSG